MNKKPLNPAISLALEDFPVLDLQGTKAQRNDQIFRYLKALVEPKLSNETHQIELPSLSRLSYFFNCSFMEIYDIFRQFQKVGYDYHFASVDGSLSLWKK